MKRKIFHFPDRSVCVLKLDLNRMITNHNISLRWWSQRYTPFHIPDKHYMQWSNINWYLCISSTINLRNIYALEMDLITELYFLRSVTVMVDVILWLDPELSKLAGARSRTVSDYLSFSKDNDWNFNFRIQGKLHICKWIVNVNWACYCLWFVLYIEVVWALCKSFGHPIKLHVLRRCPC